MVGNFIRAALLGAAMLSIAGISTFAQQVPTLPADIVAQLNQAASSQSDNADFAQAVAQIVAANPALAEAIAGTATQIRPAAAQDIASSLAPLISVTEVSAVVNAIVNALPPADRPSAVTMIVSAYLNNAPPSAKDDLIAALALVIAQQTAPAAGGRQNTDQASGRQGIDTNTLQNQLNAHNSNASPS
jgi:hypothetical protein